MVRGGRLAGRRAEHIGHYDAGLGLRADIEARVVAVLHGKIVLGHRLSTVM